MKSKNQIAQDIYGCDFEDLTGGEKAGVTRRYTSQKATPKVKRAVANTSGFIEVKFGRPGINGVKTCLVAEGTNVGDAEKQAGTKIDYKKEGFMIKSSTHYSVGQILKATDVVYDGDLIMIAVGVESA